MSDLMDFLERPKWHSEAACKGASPAAFFPEHHHDRQAIRLFCDRCPVRDECLNAGLREPIGIWGGHTESERRRLRRDKRKAVA